MQTVVKISDLTKAHGKTPTGMMFYDSLESVRKDINMLGYVSVIDRAWKELKIGGVLCLDCRPVLYFKEYGRPLSLSDRLRLQKLFWNQGVANILVLADPTSVYIYSGLTKPENDQTNKGAADNALIETLERVDYVQRIRTLYHDLATGNYYKEKRKVFDPDQTVDAWLLDNLRALRNALILGDKGLSTTSAHAFIGRVLFLCYLLDRGIVAIGTPARGQSATMLLAERLESGSFDFQLTYLYDLFKDLKIRFNGNMFDQDLEHEKEFIQPIHLEKLRFFFGGHEVESGQRYFGFWPYNFKMIPVETISAIYEDFLTTEDPKEQRGKGAFYTPRFLAEMVVDTAVRDNTNLFDGSFLDPACGSGIFLVILFNRLANRWIYSQTGRITYTTKANALRDILAFQIRGVDVAETACRIACFSLYLAYLDFFNPPDIQNHVEKTGQPLPKLLDYGDIPGRPRADIPVIVKADFLAKETLSGETFNCIIGNPPWEGRGSKQVAQKFMQKAPELLKKDGTGCLLLPTKILQNQTDDFQSEWLKQVTLEIVLQMADYSFLLFQNALCPAFIARFKNTISNQSQHRIEFTAPKFNRDGLRKGVVTINPSSRTWLPLSDILEATRSKTTPVAWKRRLWGTQRDQKLLDLLQALPPLSEVAGKPGEGKRWIKGQGYQPYYPEKAKNSPHYPNPKPNPWELDHSFLDTDEKIQLVVFQHESITLGERLEKIGASKTYLRRSPNQNLFKAPMVISSHGFGKIAYCNFDALFQSTIQSIAGPKSDESLLIFLAGYLKSKLANYFLFHTSANWGSERDKVHLNELLRVPFPLPGHEFISLDSKKIVKQVAQKFDKLRLRLQDTFNELRAEANRYAFLLKEDDPDISKQWQKERKRQVDEFQNEIEPMIYSYFDLTNQEIMLIEDTIRIFEPSSTPTTWDTPKTVTLDPIEKTSIEPYATKGLGAYADTLTKTLNDWAKAEEAHYRVNAEGGTDKQTGLAMITISLSGMESVFQYKSISQDLAENLNRLHQQASKEHGTLFYQRDILLFQEKRIHIVRPNILLNWTRTAALNDAARIYGEIVQSNEAF
ncbi:MAG: hypothetical protein C0403_14590 [Desulfobacterium sp.]|nr:hypothetical protein [Desulfobacterium sp.]